MSDTPLAPTGSLSQLPASGTTFRSRLSGDRLGSVRAAVVQAAPAFLDREATVAKACDLIAQAAGEGAELIVFPEGFIPTHPIWFHFHSATSEAGLDMSAELFRNSVVVGSPTTDSLVEAARTAGAWVVMGICEKEGGTTGTMWNSSITLSPDGDIAGVHRKLTPTVGERLVHTGGHSDGLRQVSTPFGGLSSLLCAENSNPLLVHSVLSQYAVVHAALWPNHFSPTQPKMPSVILNSSRALAYQAGCYVLNAASVLDDATRRQVANNAEDEAWLKDPANVGGSCIVEPGGAILAGPASDEETVLVADLDLDRLIRKKVIHDYAGHYNRPDVLRLVVEPAPGPGSGPSPDISAEPRGQEPASDSDSND